MQNGGHASSKACGGGLETDYVTDKISEQGAQQLDVVVVGAGFAGLYLVHKLRSLGYDVLGLEAAADVGGTWYWNRYPGARCDVESLQYSYSFSEELQQEWRWSERFAPQPEILAYLGHVADRFDLRRSFLFNTRVASARYDESANLWSIATETGDRFSARFCLMATGNLSVGRIPEFAGLQDFAGEIYHTGNWPHEGVDFTGKRVGVVGTGSSAVQSIPPIAEQAEHLYVFQRTPHFSVPARNGPIEDQYDAEWKRDYPAQRAKARSTRSGVLYDYGTKSALEVDAGQHAVELGRRWEKGGTNFLYAYNDTLRSEASNQISANFVRERIGEIVTDPAVADKLMPKDYPIGTKRICVDTDFYATFNRPNVTLVDVRPSPITGFDQTSLKTADSSYQLDAVVFATGFDAMTGALLKMDIVGRNGHSLRDKWAEGPKTYLGLAIAGFPNMFIVTGPGSPSVLSNVVIAIEQHVEWIVDCIEKMEHEGIATIEAEESAQQEWVDHVNDVACQTLYYQANSWFLGANVPGKPRVFMPYVGGFNTYVAKCDDVVRNGYAGFTMTKDQAEAIPA